MQTALMQHYCAEFLENFLKDLSKKFPFHPISGILQNYMYMPDGESEHARIKVAGAELYNLIKVFEQIPDEDTVEPMMNITFTPIGANECLEPVSPTNSSQG